MPWNAAAPRVPWTGMGRIAAMAPQIVRSDKALTDDALPDGRSLTDRHLRRRCVHRPMLDIPNQGCSVEEQA